MDKSKWRFVRLEASRSPSVAAALPHTEVKADPSKKENDAATRVQANVRKHQAEADYQRQKLQAETEKKRLLQAMADEEPAVVEQQNMRMVDAQKQRKELTAERDADGISTT